MNIITILNLNLRIQNSNPAVQMGLEMERIPYIIRGGSSGSGATEPGPDPGPTACPENTGSAKSCREQAPDRTSDSERKLGFGPDAGRNRDWSGSDIAERGGAQEGSA